MEELFRQVLSVLRGMWSRRWIGVAVAWTVACLGAFVAARAPERYEAQARVFVDTQTVLKPLMQGLTVQPEVEQMVGMVARTMVTRPNVEKIVKSLKFDVDTKNDADLQAIVDDLGKRIKVSGGGRENLFNISYRDANPEHARLVVEKLVAQFVDAGVGNKRRDTEEARQFIDEQIKIHEEQLGEAENRLKEFKIKNFGLTQGNQDFFTRMSALTEEVTKIRSEFRAAELSRDALKRELASVEPTLITDANPRDSNIALPDIDVRIEAQRKQLDDLLRRFTENHPDVITTKALLRQLEDERRREVERQRALFGANRAAGGATNPVYQKIKVSLAEAEANVASLRSRYGDLSERLAQLRATATNVPRVEAEMAQLNRDYDVIRKNYELLVQRRESVKISQNVDDTSRLADFRIIDPPRVQPSPVFPGRKVLILMALAVSLLAGAGACFGLVQLRPTVQDLSSLRTIANRPTLGGVTMITSGEMMHAQRMSNLRFGMAVSALILAYIAWLAWLTLQSAPVMPS